MNANTPAGTRTVTVACAQMACTWDLPGNVDRAEGLIRSAAGRGAQIIQVQELFEAPYFCIEQHAKHFELATTLEESSTIRRFQELAKSLKVVLPVSWFERAGRAFFNSVAVIDADGSVLGVYRKSHIPNDVGYQEKQYFSPGDTGFRVWQTKYAPIGVAICWDQWFPGDQLTTAQTAQLPIQDPNNGVSDPTFVGLPKIGTLQVRAGARWNGFDLSLFGRNLTDAHPLIYQSRDTTESDLFVDHSLRPRTVGVTVTYRY